jgi:8-oxo-dGTP pyrophosphatase MutT (NUDIX family)
MDFIKTIRMELAPEGRLYPSAEWVEKQQPKVSAVAIILSTIGLQPSVLLTRRVEYGGVHSGQMSFPGGRLEQHEQPLQAAIRETWEEVGIDLAPHPVISELLPLYIPPSNFLVYPFVFQLNHPPELQPNEEVAYSRWIGWNDLVEANIHQKEIIENRSVPGFLFENDFVWGATGMLLNEIRKTLFIS